MSNGSRPRIIWSFWNTLAVPEAVATNVFTWSARNPTYVVRLLNAQSVACYLPDDTFADIASVPLRTDLIRLALLYRYGGVWMDALNVLVEPLDAFIPWASLEAGGLYAISDATYSNPNTTDFVESWMLASCRGSPTIKRWLHLLTNLVRSNNGGVKGIISSRIYDQKTLAAYAKINALLPAPGGPTHWAEYLVICAAFTFLYHHRADFRHVVETSRLDETHSVGYMLQLHYNWSMSEVNKALLARMGTHPLHERLMSSRIIKVSTNNMGIINARRGVLRHILGPPPTDDSRPRHAFQLVLARYDEPLDWSNQYRGVRAIYNMGAPVPHNSRHRMDYYSERPDLSTDAEAFLAYVEDHYDLLPEYVAFSRGAIDSSFAWVRRDYGAPMFGSMLEEARRNGCSNSHAAHPDSDGEFGFRFTSSPHSAAKRRAIGRRTASNFGEFFHDVLGLQLAPGELLRVFPDGMLVVSRAHILSRSRAYYSQMRRRLGASGGAVEAQYTERSWYHIFRCADLTLQNPPPPPIDCAANFDTPTGCCGYEHVFVPEAERCPAHRPVCVDNLPGKHWGHCVERGAAAAAVDRRKPVVPIDCAGHYNHSTGCCGFSHMYVPERERCPSHLPICVDNLPGKHWGHCVTA
ncbi:hypothetical protein AB1Y20_021100 [Prymnesium parvum]|uniref:Protein xylosyltransferase n=1 Tax=Prymnesium parvum TaxID=97485 RepID=A0AB34JHU6_PRYPA